MSRYFPGYYNIIPNGVDVEHFSREREPIPQYDDDKLNILFVGRLEKRKGVNYLLQAFAEVKKEMPEHATAHRRAADAGGARLPALGTRDRGCRTSSSSATSPTTTWRATSIRRTVVCAPATGNESQGIVLLEAMAAGRPLVASNIEGYASVITHGVEGLLVRPKDADAPGDALLDLLSDPDRRREMGENGRQRAQEYSWERVSQRVLTYYERLQYETQDQTVKPTTAVVDRALEDKRTSNHVQPRCLTRCRSGLTEPRGPRPSPKTGLTPNMITRSGAGGRAGSRRPGRAGPVPGGRHRHDGGGGAST